MSAHTPPSGPPPREFWLRQYSQDGGMYSDIRVMKPSDCDLGVSPPPGHDNLKYYDEVHVIEKSAFDSVVAERDALLADNETGAKLFFDYWQSTLKERDALKFELQSKQRPLSEQVLALTIEKDALIDQKERLVIELSKVVKEEDALAAEVEMLKQVIKHDTDKIEAAYAAKLRVAVEAAKLGLSFAPKGPVPEGLGPMFYHTLNYEDECKLQERIDQARQALAEIGED